MLFVLAAVAAEPEDAFDCPALTVPADGLRYEDPGEISDAVYDVVERWILAQYDGTCPAACVHRTSEECTYADDCTTVDGTHIVVDYVFDYPYWNDYTESWGATIERADGTTLTFSTLYHYDWPSVSPWTYEHAWEASWSGSIGSELPDQGQIVVSTLLREYNDSNTADWGYDVETLSTGNCVWSVARSSSGYALWSAMDTWYGMDVQSQRLEIAPSPPCGPGLEATLDGALLLVDEETWALLPDEDGDLAGDGYDCDETDPGVNACADDPVCDGLDQDCDGADDTDGDGDGYAAECAGGDDCDDADHLRNPGERESAVDGIDEDCDGFDAPIEGQFEGERADRVCGKGCGALLLLPLGWRRRGVRVRGPPSRPPWWPISARVSRRGWCVLKPPIPNPRKRARTRRHAAPTLWVRVPPR